VHGKNRLTACLFFLIHACDCDFAGAVVSRQLFCAPGRRIKIHRRVMGWQELNDGLGVGGAEKGTVFTGPGAKEQILLSE